MEKLLLAAVAVVLGVVLWKSREEPSTTPRCPALVELDVMLNDVIAGRTTNAEAEIMAQNYDRAGCPDAARALRVAAGARKGSPGTVFEIQPGVFETKPKPDMLASLFTAVTRVMAELEATDNVRPTDLYQIQQLGLRYPAAATWLQTYLDRLAPGYPPYAYDAAAHPEDYFRNAAA